MFLVPFPGNQRREHLGLACEKEFLPSTCDLGLPFDWILLSAKEGAFERPKALMGGRQLRRRGQLLVGDEAHHHFRGPLGGVREQRPPFAAELPAFWVWPWRPRYLIASLF